jgi:hypothetical protein
VSANHPLINQLGTRLGHYCDTEHLIEAANTALPLTNALDSSARWHMLRIPYTFDDPQCTNYSALPMHTAEQQLKLMEYHLQLDVHAMRPYSTCTYTQQSMLHPALHAAGMHCRLIFRPTMQLRKLSTCDSHLPQQAQMCRQWSRICYIVKPRH